jgi:phosphopantothenoylcysteine decarboxylase
MSGVPTRRRPRILLGLTGSVATVKWQELCCALISLRVGDVDAAATTTSEDVCDVRIVVTESARHFMSLAAAYNSAADAQLRGLLVARAAFQFEGAAGEGRIDARAAAGVAHAGAAASVSHAGAPAGGADSSADTVGAHAVADNATEPPWDSLLLSDADEWRGYAAVGADPVLHIELRKWADVLVIAPLSANTLAKLAHGQADNLLTSTARCWEFADEQSLGEEVPLGVATRADAQGGAAAANAAAAAPPSPRRRPLKPVVVAPAMNMAMWAHPLTRPQVDVLRGLGFTIVPPASKRLACGDFGEGAMAACADIVSAVRHALRDCAGAREFA